MEKLRTCRFYPYLKGKGPSFTLNMWDAGNNRIKYQLTMDGVTLFKGNDFRCSPLHALDSDECVHALMGFLTLHPGTDRDYFADYSQEHMDFCAMHAEALAWYVENRYGEESAKAQRAVDRILGNAYKEKEQ
jgi:hypothetical protein